jgi:hypothetical protein
MTNAFAVIENKAGEVVGQMGTTFNERNGKTAKAFVIISIRNDTMRNIFFILLTVC